MTVNVLDSFSSRGSTGTRVGKYIFAVQSSISLFVCASRERDGDVTATTVIVIDVPYYCLSEEARLIEGRLLFSRTDSAVIKP